MMMMCFVSSIKQVAPFVVGAVIDAQGNLIASFVVLGVATVVAGVVVIAAAAVVVVLKLRRRK